MITLTSNTQSEQELIDAVVAHGVTPVVETKPVDPAKADAPTPTTASPGEAPSGPTGETVPASEPGKDKTQETQAAPPVAVPPVEPKPEAKFETRRKQLERQVARLHEDLDLERGSKATLQTKLAEVQAQLAELKPAAAPKDDSPVKPKRPTLAGLEFDQEKFDAAMAQYDADNEAYLLAMQQQAVTSALAARDRNDADKRAKDAADAYYAEYEARRDEGKAEIEGYDDLMASLPDISIPDAVETKILESEIPAHLIHFFFKDAADNNGKELARLSRLDPVLQRREVAKIENLLITERDRSKQKSLAPVVETAAPAAPPKPEIPAKPPVKAVPEAPIEPVGSRTTGRTPTLKDATNFQEHLAMRNKGVVR